jgi:hypothetical protein
VITVLQLEARGEGALSEKAVREGGGGEEALAEKLWQQSCQSFKRTSCSCRRSATRSQACTFVLVKQVK